MLALASPRWATLSHAFGSAEDIPRLLEALRTVEGEEERSALWFGVSATLCPEDRAVSAAYAAVPHLLAVGEAHGATEQVTAMHVVTLIELNRHRAGSASMPDDLLEDYARAIESLPARVGALAAQPWDTDTAQLLAAALLAGKRQPALARALLALGAPSSPRQDRE